MTGRRGAHRVGAWTVSGLVEAVERQAVAARHAHLRSLRRPVAAGQDVLTVPALDDDAPTGPILFDRHG